MAHKYYFFIGTIAEFIKVLPVMREFRDRGVDFKVISTGQNRLEGSDLLALANLDHVDIVLNNKPIKKSAVALLLWFFETLIRAMVSLRSEFETLPGIERTLIVHGDTVSTLMGALIGKLFRIRVAHVEAGYRSGNFLQPFPEEIDRYLTSFLADIHFAPYAAALDNLKRRSGVKINTRFNTNIDSLRLALERAQEPQLMERLKGRPYFIFIMHRQENLLNAPLVREVLDSVKKAAEDLTCVFVMHALTRATLERLDLLHSVEDNQNIFCSERLAYFEFITLLNSSEFIMTDGGGNQQESYYLGKPCLILRNLTEGSEGIGENVIVSKNDVTTMRDFIEGYSKLVRPAVSPEVRPSEIIVDTLTAT